MSVVLVDAGHGLDIDRLYRAWQRVLQPTGPSTGTAPDGRLLYPDMPTTFLAILTQHSVAYEEVDHS